MKLFLDANVLFTAARTPTGKAALIIDWSREGYWKICTSAYAIEEARRNLERKSPNALPQLAKLFRNIEIIIPSLSSPCPENLPIKDRPIFQAAHTGTASHLLTCDLKDFGPIMNRPDLAFGIIVQTVGEFLENI